MNRIIKFRAFWKDTLNQVDDFYEYSIDACNDDDLHVNQFTGLHDVNGVEIYEGDIVECDEHFYYEILWSEKYHSWHASECGGLVDLPGEVMVIGNIYENPELLNVGV